VHVQGQKLCHQVLICGQKSTENSLVHAFRERGRQ
jgi:hypothetical protein